MEPILLQTSEADAGTRLDACLARAIEDLTRSAAAKAIEDGRVLVNGKAPNKSYKLTGHEQIEFTPEEPRPSTPFRRTSLWTLSTRTTTSSSSTSRAGSSSIPRRAIRTGRS